jgi:peptide/nickel transport system permease protein
MIGDALEPTAALALLALALAVPAGILLAVVIAVTGRRWLRELLLTVPPIAQSLPTFWVGLLLMQIFAFGLGVVPASGSALAATILPAIALAIPAAALLTQTLAVGLLGEASQPYAVAASARGYRPWRIVTRHTLHNAIAPALSMTGMLIGWLLAGAVIVETVYARDGLGRLVQHAVSIQDLPVLQGVVIFSTLVFLIVSAVVDLVQAIVDPRMRDAGAKASVTI